VEPGTPDTEDATERLAIKGEHMLVDNYHELFGRATQPATIR